MPGSSVFSAGLPDAVDPGRISPRAPRLVFSVTSASWVTYPNSFGLPSLPLRIGRASGSASDTIRSLIGSPATRLAICCATLSQRSANSSSFAAAPSFALAPRPRALRLATAASRRASPTDRSNSSPVCAVSSSTSVLASPERRRIVRPIARNLRPSARERSRTRAFFSPIIRASLRPSRASARTPCDASPASVGYFTSASTTVESTLTARGRNRFSRVALTINARVSSLIVSAPSRRVSFLIVDSSGTRSDSEIRQNRRRWIESETSAHQRPIAPPVALLEHHQPHVGLHRDRRPPIAQHRATRVRPPAESAPRSAPAAPDPTAPDPAPPDRRAARAPRPATPRPTTTPPAPQQRQHTPPLDQKPAHLQGILAVTPDGTTPTASHLFRGK